jgi:DNA-binding transcriptional LysR family regulator
MRTPAKSRAYKDTTAQQLRSFHETARLGSFSAAATVLGLANPTVWQQVRALERDIGVRLLEPDGRGCRLTEDGVLLANLVGPLVSGLVSLKRRFNEARGQQANRLVVATTPRILAEDLPECVVEFRRRHPQVSLTLKEMWDEEVHDSVESRRADVGVILNRGPDLGDPWAVSPWLTFEPLYDLDVVLITPRDHPLARRRRVQPGHLAHYPLVNAPRSLPDATVTAILGKAGVPSAGPQAVEAHFTESIRRYVELGLGIGLIAVPRVRKATSTLHERVMSGYFGRPTIFQVLRKGEPASQAVANFTTILRKRFA